MTDDDKPCTHRDLKAVATDIKKEVRWLLLLGLAGSQLIHSLDVPSLVTTTGSIVATAVFAGKVAASFFVR